MARINKTITLDQVDAILCALEDAGDQYAHGADPYDAGIVYGIELTLQALGFDVNRDEDGELQDISW